MTRANANLRLPRLSTYPESTRRRALIVIEECKGNLTIASQRLGVSIPTLSRWRSARIAKEPLR